MGGKTFPSGHACAPGTPPPQPKCSFDQFVFCLRESVNSFGLLAVKAGREGADMLWTDAFLFMLHVRMTWAGIMLIYHPGPRQGHWPQMTRRGSSSTRSSARQCYVRAVFRVTEMWSLEVKAGEAMSPGRTFPSTPLTLCLFNSASISPGCSPWKQSPHKNAILSKESESKLISL